jgi:hypothetical protein
MARNSDSSRMVSFWKIHSKSPLSNQTAFQLPYNPTLLNIYSKLSSNMGQLKTTTSEKYLSLFLPFVFCAILSHHRAHCGSSNTNVTNYTITTIGYELCTVHLKSFTSKPAELEAIHQVVEANQDNHVLWTIGDHNASSPFHPSIRFYESCSINVVLDFIPPRSYLLIRNYVRTYNSYS